MRYKKLFALLLAGLLAFSFAACEKTAEAEPTAEPAEQEQQAPAEPVTLQILAPEELMGVLADAVYRYKGETQNVSIKVTYDEGIVQAAKVEAGVACDIYISDEERFMDWVDFEAGYEANPNGNDCIVSETRTKILHGPGNPKYSEEDVPAGETYTADFSAAVCRTTAHSYESERFIEFLAGGEAADIYEAYGYEPIE
jgi:ABC-type molybdate transport system substrate-binding protein